MATGTRSQIKKNDTKLFPHTSSRSGSIENLISMLLVKMHFVDSEIADRILSKNFGRQSISSKGHFADTTWYFSTSSRSKKWNII